MQLDAVIAELLKIRTEHGGDVEVQAICVDENTAHPNDGGGCSPRWEEGYFPIKVENGKVQIGEWDEYYST